MGEATSPFFMYKDKPLVRSGNTLYYGSMQDPYVVMLQILGTKEEHGRPMAQDVMVQLCLLYTSNSLLFYTLFSRF